MWQVESNVGWNDNILAGGPPGTGLRTAAICRAMGEKQLHSPLELPGNTVSLQASIFCILPSLNKIRFWKNNRSENLTEYFFEMPNISVVYPCLFNFTLTNPDKACYLDYILLANLLKRVLILEFRCRSLICVFKKCCSVTDFTWRTAE